MKSKRLCNGHPFADSSGYPADESGPECQICGTGIDKDADPQLCEECDGRARREKHEAQAEDDADARKEDRRHELRAVITDIFTVPKYDASATVCAFLARFK